MKSTAGNNFMRRPMLSIVIPAFNEEQRLPETLRRVAEYASAQSHDVEVIVVDNASTDATGRIASEFASRFPFIRCLSEGRRGKGAAVRKGMLAATGEYLLFCDADLAVPIEEASRLISFLRGGYDIAIGSREATGAKRHGEPFYRHLMGRVFNLVVRVFLLPGIRDSQCGFKCLSCAAARELFGLGRIDGWGFDAEILFIARMKGYRAAEVPVEWYYGERSKVNPVQDSWHMLNEVLDVRANGRRGIYGRKSGVRPEKEFLKVRALKR